MIGLPDGSRATVRGDSGSDEVGQRLPVDHVQGGVEQQQEAGPAGVDDAGVLEHRQQLRRSVERRAAAVTSGAEDVDQRAAGVGGVAGRFGGLPHDGEDRALDGCEHRRVGAGSRRLQRRLQRPRPVASSADFNVDAMPRRICDRMTPLLPRAPISAP